jgi:threonyl-tRNA synthetase
MAFLIEYYYGAFPVWLAPVQVKLLSVGESHHDFCLALQAELRANRISLKPLDTISVIRYARIMNNELGIMQYEKNT